MSRWPFEPAAVAAGALDDDQHAGVADALRVDPEFAAEVARYQQIVDALEGLPGVAWDPVPPPPLAVQVDSTPPLRTQQRHGRRQFTLLAAAAIVVVAVGVGFLVRLTSRTDRTESRVVVLAPLADEPAGVDATVVVPTVASGGQVHLRITGATPTPDGFVEELWLMNSGTDLVSLGTFRVGDDGSADATFSTAANVAGYDYVDASREPDDGNPAHSGTSILRSSTLR